MSFTVNLFSVFNTVKFPQNTHNQHPIAHSHG